MPSKPDNQQIKKNYNLTMLYFPEHVMDKLQYIKLYPLTVVEAPSGFGKTTAVRALSNSLGAAGAAVYWYTFLGESLAASWKGLCTLFEQADPESARKMAELSAPDEDSLPLLMEILENLECPTELFLVLDNFQEIKFTAPLRLLEALACQGSDKLHLIVMTQPLASQGEPLLNRSHRVYHVPARDLTFTREDTANYYQQAGLRVTPRQLDNVYNRCEGWIAALYLQMLAFAQTGSFESGDMERLLQTAVWARLSSEEQSALLTLSVFTSFTLPQAEYMAAPHNLLESWLQENPFVRFDRDTRNFHPHSILRDYLVTRFEEMPDAFRVAAWLQGGEWFEKIGAYADALRFYHYAGAYEKILGLPLHNLDMADSTVGESARLALLDLLEKTEYSVKLRYPRAMITTAFALFFLGEQHHLPELFEEVAAIIADGILDEKERQRLYGELQLLLSFQEYNRIECMSVKHREALELIGGPTSLIDAHSTWTFGAPSVLYMFYRESGALRDALEQMDLCMPWYYRLTHGHGSGAEIVMRAEAEFYRGGTDAAEALSHKALLVADSHKQNSIAQCALFLLTRIAMLRGDFTAMKSNLQSLRERAMQNREDLCRHTIDLCEGFLSVTLDEAEHLPEWLAQGDLSEKYLSPMVTSFAHIIYGRALLQRKEYLKLQGVGEFFLDVADFFPYILPRIYTLIHMAQASVMLSREAEAIDLLSEALATALPDKIYLPFVENCAGLQILLPQVATRVADLEGLEKVAELSRSYEEAMHRLKGARPKLTDREQEVCALIAAGLTNKEIAERLFVSLSTVKTLVSRILEKTGTTSRTQLVGRRASM